MLRPISGCERRIAQKCERQGFRVRVNRVSKVRISVSLRVRGRVADIRRSGVWADKPIAAVRPMFE